MISAVNVSSNCLSMTYLSIECCYTVIHFCDLHPVNIRFWNIKSLRWRVSGRNTLPAKLNSFSTAVNDAETVRQSLKLGKTFIFDFQYWRGSLLWSIVGWLQGTRRNGPMLAYCWVIIDNVDNVQRQLRQRSCSLGAVQEDVKITPPPRVFITQGKHNDQCTVKNIYFLSLDINLRD